MSGFPHGSDRFSVALGLEHWREGETTLTIDPAGKADITNRRVGRETHFEGTLTTQQLDEWSGAVGSLAAVKRLGSPREPDDVPLKLRFYQGDELVAQNDDFWHDDRYTMPEVNQVVRLFDQLVRQVSNGALTK